MDLTAAQTELGARGFDPISTARRTILLNTGMHTLDSLYPWPWLETTDENPAPQTIANLRQVLSVADRTNNQVLTPLDVRSVLEIDPDLTTTGTPDSWYLDGWSGTIRVHPISVVTLYTRYIRWASDLSSGTDTPLIPARHHPVWLDFASVEAYKERGDFERAAGLHNDLMTRQVPQMVDVYLGHNLQGPELIPFHPDYHGDT